LEITQYTGMPDNDIWMECNARWFETVELTKIPKNKKKKHCHADVHQLIGEQDVRHGALNIFFLINFQLKIWQIKNVPNLI
jgi:hypothetical protein